MGTLLNDPLLNSIREKNPRSQLVYWINEREKIRQDRICGRPSPWTKDVILATYRFCNVVRMDDKVSFWLRRHWYGPFFDHPNILIAVALGRFFNLPETLEQITPFVFGGKPYNGKALASLLRTRKQKGHKLFNGAYMVRGNDGVDKVESVVEYYVRPLLSLRDKVRDNSNSMQNVHAILRESYGLGSFMAGQIVADLRWAMKGTWEDKNDWAPIGPGSQRGMNRLHSRKTTTPLPQEKFLEELRELKAWLSVHLHYELFQRMELHDYQNCLCEFDGYMRTLMGEGRKKEVFRGPDKKYGPLG